MTTQCPLRCCALYAPNARGYTAVHRGKMEAKICKKIELGIVCAWHVVRMRLLRWLRVTPVSPSVMSHINRCDALLTIFVNRTNIGQFLFAKIQ
jgi:hypothetical protein